MALSNESTLSDHVLSLISIPPVTKKKVKVVLVCDDDMIKTSVGGAINDFIGALKDSLSDFEITAEKIPQGQKLPVDTQFIFALLRTTARVDDTTIDRATLAIPEKIPGAVLLMKSRTVDAASTINIKFYKYQKLVTELGFYKDGTSIFNNPQTDATMKMIADEFKKFVR